MNAEKSNYVCRYKIGNAPRPSIGDCIRVPFKGEIRRALVLDFTQDEVLVEVKKRHHES